MDERRRLPSVTALLELDAVQTLGMGQPRAAIVGAARRAVAEVRDGCAPLPHDPVEWSARVAAALEEQNAPALTRVLNATGVVLHTNLGRAPLASEAVAAMRSIAEDYCNIEYDLASGSRGSRDDHCVGLLRELTGATDALVVNNCAAAVTLALRALAFGSSVAISRGELVEIGGSFRVPEVMQVAGVRLAEVGTTNRTHLRDYERALDAGAAAVVKVHRSNFRIEGFAADASLSDLAELCERRGVPLIHDFGSGLMLSLEAYGLRGEPTASDVVRDVVRAGTAATVMSGDKLLGGPQAGIILGDNRAIAALRQDPFARAVRVDKLTIAALAATLQLYRDVDRAKLAIPTLRMLVTPPEELNARSVVLADRLQTTGIEATAIACEGAVGAGAFPTTCIPSFGVSITGDAATTAARLRAVAVPVIGRIHNGALILNLRSVPERNDILLGDMVIAAFA